MDEVMFTDPAVNMAVGRGFTSTAWGSQPRDTFFAGNSPLYSLCLYPWIACFGISPMAVRSFNYVVIVAACGVLWRTLAQQAIIRSKQWRTLLAIIVLCGNGVGFSYRSGRYDCLGMLLVVCIWSTWLRRGSLARSACLMLLCAALPWTGLQLIPYLGCLSLLMLLFRGRNGVKDVVVLAAGVLVGAVSMCLLFASQGVWSNFQTSVRLLSGQSRSLEERFLDGLRSLVVDPSMVLLGGLLVSILIWDLIRRRSRARPVLLAAVFFAVGIPFALAVVGKFPRYYAWMSYIPAAICLGIWLERAAFARAGKVFAATAILVACLVGLPARTIVTFVEWNLRDYKPVSEAVDRSITPKDWVYCDCEGYYAAKVITPDVFLRPYRFVMSARERASMTVLVVRPESAQEVAAYFGGRWTCIGGCDTNTEQGFSIATRFGFGSKPYKLAIYRRES